MVNLGDMRRKKMLYAHLFALTSVKLVVVRLWPVLQWPFIKSKVCDPFARTLNTTPTPSALVPNCSV